MSCLSGHSFIGHLVVLPWHCPHVHADCSGFVEMSTTMTMSSASDNMKSTESSSADSGTQGGVVAGIGKYSCLFSLLNP